MIRDSVLRSSGLLTSQLGGASVYPPQPESVVKVAYGNSKWPVSKGGDRYRRSLYTFSKRTAPFAAYLSFDGPTGESCIPRRERSNTPLQALTLMNDSMFTEASVAIAEQETKKELAPEQTAIKIFQRIVNRRPGSVELEKLLEFYQAQTARIKNGEINAGEILGETGKASTEAAAWAMVGRALFNLDETITKG